jgi:hypothetical protein
MTKWLLIPVMLLLAACEEEQSDRQDQAACEPIQTYEDAVLLSDPFDITGAEITGDCLKITVRYGGGCMPHDFTLDYTFLPDFSYFTGVLHLSHNANGDLCKALCTGDVYFDLTGIQEPGMKMISLILREHLENSDYQLLINYYY